MRIPALMVLFVVASGNAFSSPMPPSNDVVVKESPAATQSWSLTSDLPIHSQLQRWAKSAGWTLNWNLEKSWLVAAPCEFKGTFQAALSETIGQLYSEGKPVRLSVWAANQYAEVTYDSVQ